VCVCVCVSFNSWAKSRREPVKLFHEIVVRKAPATLTWPHSEHWNVATFFGTPT